MILSAFMKREELRRFLSDLYEIERSRFIKIEVLEENHGVHKISIESTSDLDEDILKNTFNFGGFLSQWGKVFLTPR